jgi:hypothetical protein
MDDDDDFPPPLSSLEEQIHAITLGAPRTLLLEGEDSDANLPIAATTVVGGQTYGEIWIGEAWATGHLHERLLSTWAPVSFREGS